MRVTKLLSSSAVSLYLVCMVLALGSFGSSSAGFIPSAQANVSEDIAKVAGVAAAVKAAAEQKQEVPELSVEAVMDEQPTWMQFSANVIALLSILAAIVPKASPHAGAVITILRKLIDIGALNVLFAKNEAKRNKNELSGQE